MNSDFLQERIAATRALIIAWETALANLALGNIQMYSMDTGQTKNTVTKLNLATLNAGLDGLYNRCATLEARATGSGVVIVRPAF